MPRPLLTAIGTFFGTGLAPFAPATVASLAFALVWWAAWAGLGPWPLGLHLAVLVAVTAVGIPVAGRLERIHGQDPSLVVIDEVAGMLVALLGIGGNPWGIAAAFCWFRFFDILKPLGIRRLERLRGGGGVGIMADDLAAGALACAAAHASVAVLRRWGVGA